MVRPDSQGLDSEGLGFRRAERLGGRAVSVQRFRRDLKTHLLGGGTW